MPLRPYKSINFYPDVHERIGYLAKLMSAVKKRPVYMPEAVNTAIERLIAELEAKSA